MLLLIALALQLVLVEVVLEKSALAQALPPPPVTAPSLDTSKLITPPPGAASLLEPTSGSAPDAATVKPLQDSLSNPPAPQAVTNPVPQGSAGNAVLDTTVGREIILEKAASEFSDEDVPIILKERTTGKTIRISPDHGLQIEDPQAKLEPVLPAAPNLPDPGSEKLLYPLPAPVPITSGFGVRIHPISGASEFHQGVDLGASMGTPVLAAFSGQILVAGPTGGLGNAVAIGHGSSQRTRYGHMSKVAVTVGQVVKQGEVIGYVGSTGESTGPHLHFELWNRSPASDWVALDSASQLKVAVAQLS
jgi:murein DD-endopeptidase MepM/ murein hydrolase activator NlpD